MGEIVRVMTSSYTVPCAWVGSVPAGSLANWAVRNEGFGGQDQRPRADNWSRPEGFMIGYEENGRGQRPP
jgi:hypothetical protein